MNLILLLARTHENRMKITNEVTHGGCKVRKGPKVAKFLDR